VLRQSRNRCTDPGHLLSTCGLLSRPTTATDAGADTIARSLSFTIADAAGESASMGRGDFVSRLAV